MNEKKRIVVLGSTGSIGLQALSVIAAHPDRMTLVGLGAGRSAGKLLEQAAEFSAKHIAVSEPRAAAFLRGRVPDGLKLYIGEKGMERLAALPEADAVVIGITGLMALPPLLAAIRAGKTVALANKESVVCGNPLIAEALAEPGAGRILPVDSEQSAIFQCLMNGEREELSRVILTASGGPFRGASEAQLAAVTPEQALAHPTWRMGRKITIDSATLFNKGLEVLEAAYLFDLKKDQIEVLIHPQSIVHSMVEYQDGSAIAQLAAPDMRLAIQYALTYPERLPCPGKRLSLADAGTLSFERPAPPLDRALTLAYQALEIGGSMPAVYNGANEAAVERFLKGAFGFLDIHRAVEHAMDRADAAPIRSLEDVFEADAFARRAVHEWATRSERF